MKRPLEITRTEVSGLPAYIVEGPPPLTGGICFGVGAAREPLVMRGVSHLVEHLALHGFARKRLNFNGNVGIHATKLFAEGTGDEVRDFLERSSRQIQDLPADRLIAERRVLRTEAAGRGGSLLGMHLSIRYGPFGPALVEYPEVGLHWLDIDEVTAWAHKYFTRDNAALFFTGEPPSDLEITLAHGVAPDEDAEPEALVQTPAWTTTPGNVVALTMRGPRSPGFWLGAAVLQHAAEERLRHGDAHSYAVVVDQLVERPGRRIAYLGADCRVDNVQEVRDALLAEFNRMRLDGPTESDLDDVRLMMGRALSDPRSAFASAMSAAETHVSGEEVLSADEITAQYGGVTGSDIAEALTAATPSVLWSVPHGCEVPDRRFRPVPPFEGESVHGREFRRGEGADPTMNSQRLRLADDGVSLASNDQALVTIHWAEVAAAIRWADRCWTIWGTNGFSLTVRARDWYQGHAALELIERRAPASLAIRSDVSLSPDEPDLDPREPPAEARPSGRSSPAPTAPRTLGKAARSAVAVALVLVALVFLSVAVLPDSASDPEERLDAASRAIGGVMGLAAAVGAAQLWRRR